MLKAFQNHIENNFPYLKSGQLLIAISGGLDSVVLTHLCAEMNYDFALAHCNFNLRGDESDDDERFVLDLANDLNVELFVEGFDTNSFAAEEKVSTQMAARHLRYKWFKDLSTQLGYDYIMTGHHADDNLETFLINLSRGTGLDGLTGIRETNESIIRPLIPFSRTEIEAYAKEHQLKWREDSSNASTKYLRNKIRHEVVPALKEANPQLLQNVDKTQQYLQDAQQIIEDAVARIEKKVMSVDGEVTKINIKKVKKLSNKRAYLYQLLKHYNFKEWNDVEDLLSAQSGKQVFSESHRLLKDRDFLVLTSRYVEDANDIIINEHETQLTTPFGKLLFDEADAVFGKRSDIIFVDYEKLKFPLSLRKWKDGDYFYPTGMSGKKKLSKYFKDEKLSLVDKENVWLLCSNDEIVWVVNRRADNRFIVSKDSKRILKIELN